MYKCCVCGKALTQPTAFACAVCAGVHGLSLFPEQWPAWARSELGREKARRRFRPGFGVSGSDLTYEPYDRVHDNQAYRRLNGVRKGQSKSPVRTGADNLFYSSTDDPEAAERVYGQLLGSLPGPLQDGLGQGLDLRVVLSDALASLPLISQRAMRAYAQGHDLTEIADAEGVSAATMGWLVAAAQERLRDILEERLGADDGARFRPLRP
jgi:DNA-directed RNA polymerase specialized sigma24 family protein